MQHHEKLAYLTGQCLPSALHFLRAVECDDVSPFVLAVTAWTSNDWLGKLEALDSRERLMFQAVHVAAAKMLPRPIGCRSIGPRLKFLLDGPVF